MKTLNESKTTKLLDEVRNFSSGIMTLREYIASKTVTEKSYSVNIYGKKRNGCYPILSKPQYFYTIWFDDKTGIDVPKLVYDYYAEIPERENCKDREEKNLAIWEAEKDSR
jgi:hypothetical protein